ncbi:hypothetical protein ACQV5I_20240, partial [Leptospira interrogans]
NSFFRIAFDRMPNKYIVDSVARMELSNNELLVLCIMTNCFEEYETGERELDEIMIESCRVIVRVITTEKISESV